MTTTIMMMVSGGGWLVRFSDWSALEEEGVSCSGGVLNQALVADKEASDIESNLTHSTVLRSSRHHLRLWMNLPALAWSPPMFWFPQTWGQTWFWSTPGPMSPCLTVRLWQSSPWTPSGRFWSPTSCRRGCWCQQTWLIWSPWTWPGGSLMNSFCESMVAGKVI